MDRKHRAEMLAAFGVPAIGGFIYIVLLLGNDAWLWLFMIAAVALFVVGRIAVHRQATRCVP